MQLHGKLWEHKFWEFGVSLEKKFWHWFYISFNFDRKTDHAGIHFHLEILGFSVFFDIYDHRHWENGDWSKCD